MGVGSSLLVGGFLFVHNAFLCGLGGGLFGGGFYWFLRNLEELQ
jgi:hypothetical protein